MGILETIAITIISAAVAFSVTLITRHLDRRETNRAADAAWTPQILRRLPGSTWIAVVIVNTGSKQALDVNLKLGGDGVVEFDSDLNLRRIRPGESIRFVITKIGNSVAYIEWTNHLGIRDHPFNLFLDTVAPK
jgi:hypothetical protein